MGKDPLFSRAVAPVVALQAQGQATQGGNVSTLAPLRYGLVRLTRVGAASRGRRRSVFVREPDAGCDRRSRYELASASLVRPKPSRQGGSESCGRRGNAGSEA